MVYIHILQIIKYLKKKILKEKKERIDLEGKIAFYGIFFDTGKFDIKPESKESLEPIAQFLSDNPEISCLVVGQTDSSGSFEINSELSLNRALNLSPLYQQMIQRRVRNSIDVLN